MRMGALAGASVQLAEQGGLGLPGHLDAKRRGAARPRGPERLYPGHADAQLIGKGPADGLAPRPLDRQMGALSTRDSATAGMPHLVHVDLRDLHDHVACPRPSSRKRGARALFDPLPHL